jgi:hypothetical protein
MHAVTRVKAASYLYRAKDPKDQSLNDVKCGRSDTKGEINADVFAYLRVAAIALVSFGPSLEPHAAAYRKSAFDSEEMSVRVCR